MGRLSQARNAADGGRSGDDGSARDGAGRVAYALLAALGVVAVAYLLGRWRRDQSDDSIDVPDAIERAEEATLEQAQKIPIGSPGEGDEDDAEPEGEDGDATESARSESTDEAALSVDLNEDRSDEEIDEMAETDAQETPAEPGAVRVDEEVAAEVAEGEGDESASDDSTDEEE
ncbi:hypothetical protein OB905_08715 [Halobacteria archaeon AArc-dxtr1]|nr:hypothetical protein [Halobacteria archaeon AArc-dxtr1]